MTTTTTPSTTNALSLMMPLRKDADIFALGVALALAHDAINEGLTSAGTVHFARFLLLDTSQPNLAPAKGSKGPFVLSVITEYDGDFDKYLQDFCTRIGLVFDAMLVFVEGGQSLIPVSKNVQAFTDFVKRNDLAQQGLPQGQQGQHGSNTGLYAAYPQSVQDIIAAFAP